MDIKNHSLTLQKTARYNVYGTLTEETECFWFVLHGSRMLSEQMLYKFKEFDPKKHFVVAPEGLHRFYEKDFGGPVVASWMTKHYRLDDIEDNGNYLHTLYNHYTAQLPTTAKKVILGFSQGGTILYRWLHRHKEEVDCIVPYAAWIPEDIDLTASKTPLNHAKTLFTYGEEDQFLTEKRLEKMKALIDKQGLDMTYLPHKGDHRIARTQLHYIYTNYITS